MLDRRLVNRPGELDLPVDFKQIPNSKHAIQITFTEPVEPESPAIDFGNFKSRYYITEDISEAAKNSYSSKDFGMLELPTKDRLLSIIPETKSALEDQSLMASLHTESPTSPPQKQPVEISNFAPSKLLKDEMDSAGDYPVSIVMSSLMNQQAKEKNSFDAAEEAKKGIKNLHVKEPFGKPMSGLMPTVFTHSEEDQGLPQRKLRMCSAENEITRFLSSSKQHILSNT